MELDLSFLKRFFRGFYKVIFLFVATTAIFFGVSYFSHLKSLDHYVYELQEEIIRLVSLDLNQLSQESGIPDDFFKKYSSNHLELIDHILVVNQTGQAFFTNNTERKYKYIGIGKRGEVKLDGLTLSDNLMSSKRLDNGYEIIVLTSNAMIKKIVFEDWIEESRIQFSLSILGPILILILLMLIEDKLIKDLEKKFLTYFNEVEMKDQEREELYRGLYYHNRCVMILIDPESSYIIDGNEAAVEYYGYNFREYPVKISEINTMPQEELDKIMSDAIQKKRNYFNFQHRLQNRMVRDVEVYSGPVVMKGKSVLCSIVHDVTDKIRAEQSLMNQQLDMERRIREKSEVLATISHEIKTPIAGIIHNVNDISLKIKDAEVQKQLQFLKLNINNLNRLVFDLLDYSRIDAGGLKFYSTQFNLVDVLSGAIELFKPIAVEKHIEMRLNLEGLKRTRFVGDAFRIGQIVNNLVSNSVKYTHKGSISISVSDEMMGSQSLVTIVVEDTGIGMKPDVVDEIFNRFYTTDISGELGGTGLGLAICRLIVEAMSGTLEVSSQEGVGTVMTLVLELDNDEGADLTMLSNIPSKYADMKPYIRILLVDDDPMGLIFIEKMLKQIESIDVKVDNAYNGKEAFNLLKHNVYQCVIVDYQLPDISGIKLIDFIKHDYDEVGEIRTILTSADFIDTSAMKIDAFLLKPIEIEKMAQTLQRFFGKYEHTASKNNLNNHVYIGYRELEELTAYVGKEELDGLLEVFLQAVDEKMNMLPQQLDEANISDALKVLHALKGSISYFKSDVFIEEILNTEVILRDQSDWELKQKQYAQFYSAFSKFIEEAHGIQKNVLENNKI
jgi:PAS domain S-box-containing protein